MRTSFSKLLLTGKAATLPMLMNHAHAYQTWTPSMFTIVTDQLTQVQVPENRLVEINALGGQSPYGAAQTIDGSATVCQVSGVVTNEISLALTGLHHLDSVFVVTSTDKGGNEVHHAGLKVGTQNLFIPASLNVQAAGAKQVAATVAIDLKTLRAQGYALNEGAKFYMQTVVFPAAALASGVINWQLAKVSEMDEITVAGCTPAPGTY